MSIHTSDFGADIAKRRYSGTYQSAANAASQETNVGRLLKSVAGAALPSTLTDKMIKKTKEKLMCMVSRIRYVHGTKTQAGPDQVGHATATDPNAVVSFWARL